MVLRVPAHGMPSEIEGGAPGDLFVVVHAAPDARFERRGADLWRRETVEVADAVLGTRVRTPTLEGSVTADVPPGTQPDTILRLRGKGLPHFGAEDSGDLFLQIQVHVPEHPSREVLALYERLRDLARKDRARRD